MFKNITDDRFIIKITNGTEMQCFQTIVLFYLNRQRKNAAIIFLKNNENSMKYTRSVIYYIWKNRRRYSMSPGMIKMWISFLAMGFMILSVFAIYVSRYKMKFKFLRFLVAFFAYIFLFLGGIMMIYVVFSGPVG